MDVEVIAHLEAVSDGFVWWAESSQVPGFSATDPALHELVELSRQTLTDVLTERGESLGEMRVTLASQGATAPTGPAATVTTDAPTGSRGPDASVIQRVRIPA